MIAEVEAGNVDTVIVKDMSRFGQNYLKVGFYTEMLFPEKGVRFTELAYAEAISYNRKNLKREL